MANQANIHVIRSTMWALNAQMRNADPERLPGLFVMAAGPGGPAYLSCQAFIRCVSLFVACNYIHVTPGEMQEYVARELFNLKKVSSDIALAFQVDNISAVYREADTDHDDRLTWPEFCTGLCMNLSASSAEVTLSATPTMTPWSGPVIERAHYIEPMRRVIITTGVSKDLHVYNSATNVQAAEWKGHLSSILNVSYLPPLACLASCSSDRTLILWDQKASTPKQTFLFVHPPACVVADAYGTVLYVGDVQGTIHAVRLSPVSTTQKTADEGLFDTRKPQILFTMQGHTDWITELVLIDDIKLLVSCSADRTLRVWNWEVGDFRYKKVGHTKGILLMSYSARYRLVITGGHDKFACIWNPLSPSITPSHTVEHDRAVIAVYCDDFCPSAISIDQSGKIIVTDLPRLCTMQVIGGVMSPFITPGLTTACFDETHRSLILYGRSVTKYKVARNVRSLFEPVKALHVSELKCVIIVVCANVIYSFSAIDGMPMDVQDTLFTHSVHACQSVLNSTGEYLLVGSSDGRVRAFQLPDLKKVSCNVSFAMNEKPLFMHCIPKTNDVIIFGAKGSLVRARYKKKKGDRGGASRTVVCPSFRFGLTTTDRILLVPGQIAAQGYIVCDLALHDKPMTVLYPFQTEHLRAGAHLESFRAIVFLHVTQGLIMFNEYTYSVVFIVPLVTPFTPAFMLRDGTDIVLVDTSGCTLTTVMADAIAVFFAAHHESHWTRMHEKLPTYKVELRNRWGVSSAKPKAGVGVTSFYLSATDLQLAANTLRDTDCIDASSDVVIKITQDLEKHNWEVAVGTTVKSPFIVPLLDHWVSDSKALLNPGCGHLVYSAPRVTLWEIMYNNKKADAIELVRSLLQGLSAVHLAGYVHMDVRPRNIALMNNGWVLGGFTQLEAMLTVGSPVGLKYSPMYCPPEMAERRTNGGVLCADPSFDMWCFGLIVAELCCGAKVFSEGEDQILQKLIACHQSWLSNRVAVEIRGLTPPALLGLLPLAVGTLRLDRTERWTAEQCLAHFNSACPDADKAPRTQSSAVSTLSFTPHIPTSLPPMTINLPRSIRASPSVNVTQCAMQSGGHMVVVEYDKLRGDYHTVTLLHTPTGKCVGTLPALEATLLNRAPWLWRQLQSDNPADEGVHYDDGLDLEPVPHTEVQDPIQDMSYFYSQMKRNGEEEQQPSRAFYMPHHAPVDMFTLAVIKTEKATKRHLDMIKRMPYVEPKPESKVESPTEEYPLPRALGRGVLPPYKEDNAFRLKTDPLLMYNRKK